MSVTLVDNQHQGSQGGANRSVLKNYCAGAVALCLLALATAWARCLLLDSTLIFNPADYGVYRGTGVAVLAGADFYSQNITGVYVPQGLPFVYTPFTALLLIPLAWLPEPLGIGGWTFLNCLALGILLLLSLLYVRPHLTGVRLAAALSATYLLALPLNVVAQHLIFGQINLLLVSLCLIDMVRPQTRYLPRGVLIGLAAGIKLTPALFILFFWVSGRLRPALTATATALATVVLGFLLLPESSSTYFGSKLSGLENVVDLGTNFATSGNSSLQGVAERWVGTHSLLLLAPLLLAVVAVAFSQAHRELACGDGFAAAAVLGCATCLLSPVSWLHHWVWVIPTLAVLVTRGRAARALAIIWMLACLAQLTDLGDLAAHAGWPIIPVEIMRSSIVLLALLAMVVLYLPSQRKALHERHPARHRRPTL